MRGFYHLPCLGMLCFLAVQSHCLAQTPPAPSPSKEGARGFTITIDGIGIPINPGETVQARLSDGKAVSVSLSRNPFSQWSDDMLSFEHPSGLTVATQKLSKSITQHMVASAVGTVIIVQEYEELDPSTLKQLMMNELTKNEVKIGADFQQSETTKTLTSGLTLPGLQGVLKSKAETKTVNVFSYGKDGHGVLLISMISDDYKQTDQPIIDKFWNTLALKF